eukprot:4335230-Pyramimonas_sp.AAC.1
MSERWSAEIFSSIVASRLSLCSAACVFVNSGGAGGEVFFLSALCRTAPPGAVAGRWSGRASGGMAPSPRSSLSRGSAHAERVVAVGAAGRQCAAWSARSRTRPADL